MHDHKSKTISSQNSSLSSKWLDFRKDLGNKVEALNAWTDKYQGLLGVLSRKCRIYVLDRSILKLRELEQTVTRFYECDVALFASENNFDKLAATKP